MTMTPVRCTGYNSRSREMKTVKLISGLSKLEEKTNISIDPFSGVSPSLDKPSPLDFDAFVPWVCLQWESPVTVDVTRLLREDYANSSKRKSSCKSIKSVRSKCDEFLKSYANSLYSVYTSQLYTCDKKSVPIKAYYDIRGQLLEVCIERCTIDIPRIVIQAFNLSMPLHLLLYRLSICGGGVTSIVIHEISKLLPHSNLTNICLDGAHVPEANYHVLLKQTSQLKTLSLNRCAINDLVCEKLATNIDFGKASSSLLTLDLGSNQISDSGAKAFGDVLRRNRHLLHLNLSGNMITDVGAMSILNHLMLFPLTCNEILELRRRKMKYMEQQILVFKQCLEEIESKKKSTCTNRRKSSCLKKGKRTKRSHSALVLEARSHALAENMTKEIIGELLDPYTPDYIFRKDGYFYCIGNMSLCSLNLAYNNLEFQSLKKLKNVIKYQEQLTKPIGATGLLRVAIDGNYIPKYCEDYVEIEIMLNNALNNRIPTVWTPSKKRVRQSRISRSIRV